MMTPASERLELAVLELRTFAQVAEQLAHASRAEPELEQVQWPWLLGRLIGRVEDAISDLLAPSPCRELENAPDGREQASGDVDG